VGYRPGWRLASGRRGLPGTAFRGPHVAPHTPRSVAAAWSTRSSRPTRRDGCPSPPGRTPHVPRPRLPRGGPPGLGRGPARWLCWCLHPRPPRGGCGAPCAPPPLGARGVAGLSRQGVPSDLACVGAGAQTTPPHQNTDGPRCGGDGGGCHTARSRWCQRRCPPARCRPEAGPPV
jgi:hypothetical protein